MNDEARVELDRILAMEPAALTEADQAFLAARRTELTEEQRINFGVNEEPEKAAQLTKAELQAELTARNITFQSTAKVAELQALLDAAPAQE